MSIMDDVPRASAPAIPDGEVAFLGHFDGTDVWFDPTDMDIPYFLRRTDNGWNPGRWFQRSYFKYNSPVNSVHPKSAIEFVTNHSELIPR